MHLSEWQINKIQICRNAGLPQSGKSQGEYLISSKSVKCHGIIIFSLRIKSGEKHKECESEGRSY